MQYIKYNFTICILLFLISNNIYSQTDYLVIRNKIENNIIVLENDDSLIPLQLIDKLNILVLTDGHTDYNTFIKYFNYYTNIDYQNINSQIPDIINKYNLLIFITDSVKDISYFSDYEKYNAKKIFCSFADVNDLIDKSFSHFFSTLILMNGKTENHQELAAQLIFGGICVSNKLEFDLNSDFKKGTGFVTEGNLRFKYTTPYELYIDSVLINQKIDSIVNNAIKNYAFPGCRVLIAKDNKVFFNKSYGYQTYDSLIAVNENTVYDLASVTKISAPLPCLMKLYDENKFDINAKFSEYWKPFRKTNKSQIIVKDVLTHQAQLTAWIPFWKFLKDSTGGYKNKTVKQDSSKNNNIKIAENKYLYKKYYKKIYDTIATSPLLKEKKYVYSDLSFYFYPEIICNLTKENYEEYLYTNFYDILGCNSMKYNPLNYYSISEIAPTEIDTFFRSELIHGKVHDEGAILMNGVSGHAGMFGNAMDVAKLMQMYLNYGEYGGYRFISDTTVKRFTAYQFKETGNRRGLGFDKPSISNRTNDTPSPDASELSFGHTGFTGTFVWADPQNGLLIIFLSNRVYPSRDNKNLMRLNVRTSIHQVIYDELSKNNK